MTKGILIFRSLVIPLLFLFYVVFTHNAYASFDPSQVSGNVLWLEADHGLYQDNAKTILATTTGQSIAVWADQSGQGNDASQMATSLQPTLNTNGSGSKPAVFFGSNDGGYHINNLSLGEPSSLEFFSGNYTIFVVYTQSNNGSSNPFLVKGSQNDDSANRIWFQNAGITAHANRQLVSSPNGNGSNANLFEYSFQASQNDLIHNAGIQSLFLNGGIESQYRDNVAFPSGSWTVGAIQGGNFYGLQGDIQALLIYNRKITDQERQEISDYLSAKYSVTVSPYLDMATSSSKAQILYDGDSITVGYGNGSQSDYPFLVNSLLGNKYTFYNFGVVGATVSQMNSLAGSQTDTFISQSFTHNIVSGFAGTNDLGNNNAGATTTYNNLVTYYTARKNAGWQVIAVTMLPRGDGGGSDPTFEADRQAINQNLRENFENYADVLVDLGNDPNIGQPGDASTTAYYVDGLHPNYSGQQIIASQMAQAIQALITPLTTLSSISVTPSNTSAIITWATDASSSSIVNYGATNTYTASTTEADTSARVINHLVSISGFTPCTVYHFQADSKQLDPNGEVRLAKNEATSTDQTFMTTGCPIQTPVISSGGGSVSPTSLAAILAPSASTTAYLNSLKNTAPGCPAGLICVPVATSTIAMATSTFTRDLTLGSQGNDVKALQIYLNAHGFIVATYGNGSSGHETNYFGSLTQAALAKFQQAHGISPSVGYFGPITRAKIRASA